MKTERCLLRRLRQQRDGWKRIAYRLIPKAEQRLIMKRVIVPLRQGRARPDLTRLGLSPFGMQFAMDHISAKEVGLRFSLDLVSTKEGALTAT